MGESSTDEHSFKGKGVIPPSPPPSPPPPCASPRDEFHKKYDAPIFSRGTIAFRPYVAVAAEVKPHIYPAWWDDFKSSEEDEPVVNEMFATSLELLVRRFQEGMQKYKLGMYPVFEVLEHGKASVQAPKDPNGSFASEGGAPLMTGIGLFEHVTPLLVKGIDSHRIDMPAHAEHDSLGFRFPKGEQGQNQGGELAILCASVSAQTILGLAGGPGAMNLPKPIFYSAAAANAIAFGGSALALLLIKKNPNAASILARVGFGSTIATFLLMMSAFMPWK